MTRQTFEVDGKTYSVRLPNAKEREEGDRIHNRIFAYTLKTGGLLEGQIMSVAREHGLWNEEKEAELKATREELGEKERILDEGGIELEEAKKIAVQMKELRTKLLIFNFMLEELRSELVSRKADVAQVEFFISRCTLDEKDRQVYKDLDDYYVNQNTPLAQAAMVAFNKLWYNFNEDSLKFPEDVFMQEYFKEELEPPKKKEKKPFLMEGKPIIKNKGKDEALGAV